MGHNDVNTSGLKVAYYGFRPDYHQVATALWCALEQYGKVRFYEISNLAHTLRRAYNNTPELTDYWPENEKIDFKYFAKVFDLVRLNYKKEIHIEKAKEDGTPNYICSIKHRKK